MDDQFRVPDGRLTPAPACTRVLSLSGGGYRGLYTARLLARIEESERFGDGLDKGGTPIGTRFDLIAGTSVGGILAAGLAAGVSARDLYAMLAQWGPTIFPKLSLRTLRKLFSEKVYAAEPLERAIVACLDGWAGKRLAEIDTPLMLTTVSWSLGELRLLRSKGLAGDDADTCTLLEATRATSAAPAHFPAMLLDDDWHVDGGLAANCPDAHALNQAQRRGVPVRMLSVGTTGVRHRSVPSRLPLRGLAWAQPALALSMEAQERMAQATCERELRERYLHLNSDAGADQEVLRGLDIATPDATAALTRLADQRFEDLLASADESRRLRLIMGDG
ncbi:patatin-like phospholipase family protein [Burkholderia sp. Ax-1719]|uniref:patatin-like phospholipase family protein n=1 Tax=Burkholderia sp. Ax-1719 TaxID=2608334 RepID=UPI00141FC20B|nr:patatin-like phospholipase family protein [Burkholderia sp. Ax-1719]NIE67092.1 patatin-like phospholipase family protein [Burkholderia sp. Ax-1719]